MSSDTGNYLHDTTITASAVVGRSYEICGDPQRLMLEAGIIPGSVRIRLSRDWLLLDVNDLKWLRREVDQIIDAHDDAPTGGQR